MDIKRLALFLLLIPAVFTAAGSDKTPLPTIDEAAANYLKVHAENNYWRLFSITMPSGSKLPDHQTGPRAIIPLTPIVIQRLEGNQELMKMPAQKAFWLTNIESKGFRNAADSELVYLVLEAQDKSLELSEAQDVCQAGTTLLSYKKLLICLIEPARGIDIHTEGNSWVYIPKAQDNDKLKFNGILQPRPKSGVLSLTVGTYQLSYEPKPLLLLNFKP
ncbi:hypothetical protein [Kangiella shandongensis]|uniref:hypothetical protein n=1 Tax=Kangiella shandongensis TaxID=2763258 RepID=UPI001CBEC1AC|nr:hypothetical protein [Kangiella shandongensis]